MIQDESGSNALSAPSLKLVALATSLCMDAEVLKYLCLEWLTEIKPIFV